VNKAVQYNPEDFIGDSSAKTGEKTEEELKAAEELKEKLDKFIDRVAFRVEEAL
jgi:hypothetical protein